MFKACVCYLYRIFIFSPNDNPSKTMKNAFCFIKKALLNLFSNFSNSILPSFSPCWPLLYRMIEEKSRTHFVHYLEKEKRYDTETLSIEGVSNKEHFYGKIMQKICSPRTSPRPCYNFGK